MGTNSLSTQSDGTVINASDINQYKTALNEDLNPRNTSGVVTTNGGSLGSSSYEWLKAFIASGHWNAGDIKAHHSYNGTVGPGQGWMQCITSEALVTMADGSKKEIKDLVENKSSEKVLCLNEKTGQIEARKITNWYKTPAKKDDFIQVKTFLKDKHNHLRITPNHELWDGKEWVPSGIAKKCFTLCKKLSKSQVSFLLGTLLGDSVTDGKTARVKLTHCEKQRGINDFLISLLRNFKSTRFKVTRDEHTQDYVNFQSDGCFNKLKKITTKEGKQYFSEKVGELFTPMSLAIFYMDDGHLRGSKYPEFAIGDEEEGENFKNMLENKFNLRSRIRVSNKFSRIYIMKDSVDAFFSIISPFILDCMSYKVPEGFKIGTELKSILETCVNEGFDIYENGLTEVSLSEEYRRGEKRHLKIDYNYKYNIEVEEHHNYFANDILTHNCTSRQINETNYDLEHGAGSWDIYIVSSPLEHLYLPNLTNRYMEGVFNTTQTGTMPITAVGNSGHTVNSEHAHTVNGHTHTISHTHTTPNHNHQWYQDMGASAGDQSYNSGGSAQGLTGGSSTAYGINVPASGTSLTNNQYTNNDSTSTNGPSAGSTGSTGGSTQNGGSTTLSIQPESIEVQYFMRII